MPSQVELADRTRRRWRRRRRVAFGTLAVLAATSCVCWNQWFRGNFGVVEPGRVYRSAQPGAGFERLVRRRNLASVLNLRGGSIADSWYAQEVRVTREAGVDLYDFPMSPSRRPTRRELLTLLDLFPRCRYPLLIHCKSGSDRTGLASALYLMEIANLGPEDAEKAFTLFYGHVELFGRKHLHEPLDEYAAWLRARGLAHTPERLRNWVEHEYQSDDDGGTFRPLRPGPREQRVAGAHASGPAVQ